MQNRVFVLNKHQQPLMPCSPRTARRLLKQGKATVAKKEPFTIQLKYGSTGYKQPISLGIDSGQRHIGIAVTSNDHVYFQGEVELRQDVKKLIDTCRTYRRSRRNRNTRYRKPRFLNRIKTKRITGCHHRLQVNANTTSIGLTALFMYYQPLIYILKLVNLTCKK